MKKREIDLDTKLLEVNYLEKALKIKNNYDYNFKRLIRIECLKNPSTQIPQLKQCLTLFDLLI